MTHHAHPKDTSAGTPGIDPILDLAIVGVGPSGLAVAVAATERGLHFAILDRGAITKSLTHCPYYMTFFSTAERLEIGGVPFTIPEPKPTRREALAHYRHVVAHRALAVRQYEEVTRVVRHYGPEVADKRGTPRGHHRARRHRRGHRGRETPVVNAARAEGLEVYLDVYPYETFGGSARPMIPKWSLVSRRRWGARFRMWSCTWR